MSDIFRVDVAAAVTDAEQADAVTLVVETSVVDIGYPMTIGKARELSMDLARAADQAKLKLPE